MPVSARPLNRAGDRGFMVPAEEKLDRALVAGLLLEVFLETPAVPVDPQIRRRHIKSKLTYSLITHLSGRITLDRFRNLIRRMERWFQFYYLLLPPLPQMEEVQVGPARAAAPDAVRTHPWVIRHLLKEWLEKAGSEILPRRPQRKLQPERLEDFFQLAQGGWFRLKDLAQYFDIDRKTAWEYVQKLLNAGLLVHNQGCSAAVRYRLADHFLKIKLTELEQQVALALPRLPAPAATQVAQSLAATAGEPFWEEHWPIMPATSHREEIIASLNRAGLLEVVCQSGRRQLLRLHRQWLKE